MKIKEVPKKIIKGGIMFPSLKTSYKKGITQKDEETYNFAPEAAPMHMGHAPCAHGMSHAPEHVKTCICSKSCARGMLGAGQNCIFSSHFLSGLSPIFNPNPVGNFLINTKPLTHYFLFKRIG